MQHAASISAEEQSIKMAQQYAAAAGGAEEGGPERLSVILRPYSSLADIVLKITTRKLGSFCISSYQGTELTSISVCATK